MNFTTDVQGFIPGIGSLIAIHHNMSGWGKHADAVAWDDATRPLTYELNDLRSVWAHTHNLSTEDFGRNRFTGFPPEINI